MLYVFREVEGYRYSNIHLWDRCTVMDTESLEIKSITGKELSESVKFGTVYHNILDHSEEYFVVRCHMDVGEVISFGSNDGYIVLRGTILHVYAGGRYFRIELWDGIRPQFELTPKGFILRDVLHNQRDYLTGTSFKFRFKHQRRYVGSGFGGGRLKGEPCTLVSFKRRMFMEG